MEVIRRDEELARALHEQQHVLGERNVQQEQKDKELAAKLQKKEAKPLLADAKRFKKAW